MVPASAMTPSSSTEMIGVADGGEPVGDDDGGTVVGHPSQGASWLT